jgi:hypothetical protein
MKKLWLYLKALGKRLFQIIIRYPLATALTVLLVIGTMFLLIFGQKVQIGGLLGSIWGKKKINSRAIPPEDRKDKDGKPIQPGESDDKGYVQAPVSTKIKEPTIFSDPNVVEIEEQNGEVKKIPLPTGVSNTDVREVTKISPNIYEVKNKDKGTKKEELSTLIELLGDK